MVRPRVLSASEAGEKSARALIRKHAGRLPDNYGELRGLPGVGDYTAGAVLSIAFGKRYPAVDGNARRVIGRIFKLQDEKQIRAIASRLVPAIKPGYFNQALMELGATICSARNPRCSECPVASNCKSLSSGPNFSAKKAKNLKVSPGRWRSCVGTALYCCTGVRRRGFSRVSGNSPVEKPSPAKARRLNSGGTYAT